VSVNKIVVEVKNISKVYKLYKKPFDRVKESFNPLKKNYHTEFYALNNISLELKRGEALGVIGGNGNGKSTLLKIIAKVLTPTSGTIKSIGRVSAILELTSNLKQEMTGRENIIYNLKIQGFTSKKDIIEKTKEVEGFAEIGAFIDQPIKIYSSGMKSRLGFGIATCVEPDILILDEVLAVGDFKFQQKCLAKINSMRDNISMIFVSHSMNSIRLFCDRVIVLEKGNLVFDAKADDAIVYYLEQEEDKKNKVKKNKIIKSFYGELFHNENKINKVISYWDKESYKLDDEMILYFSFYLKYSPKNLIVGVPIWNDEGIRVTAINSDYADVTIDASNNIISGKLKINCIFNPSMYTSILSIMDNSEFLYRGLIPTFKVEDKTRTYGLVTIESIWNIKNYVDIAPFKSI